MTVETEELKKVFDECATVVKNGEKFIDARDFVLKFFGDVGSDGKAIELFTHIAHTSEDGLVSFTEFEAFEKRLRDADALHRIVFQLFDRNGKGHVGHDDFVNVIRRTALYRSVPVDLDGSRFIKSYFGNDKKRLVEYAEFGQLLRDFLADYGNEVFRKFDQSGKGFITPENFKKLMLLVNGPLLTENVKNNIIAAIDDVPNKKMRISLSHFTAFTSMLNNVELLKIIYGNAANELKTQKITKDEFLRSALMVPQVTPLEVDRSCHLIHPRNGKIALDELHNLAHDQNFHNVHDQRLTETWTVSDPVGSGFSTQIWDSVYKFALGSVSGACGAVASYPIDLVKTRMQNQRSSLSTGTVMYKNSFDCFKKVIKYEGILGLYRGLLPQLIGTAPEKAIKLTFNDLIRGKLSSDGKVSLVGDVFAGATAGFFQVFVTNPLEIVKVRLQVAGEVASGSKLRAWDIVKELGVRGLYKGASACFPRVMVNSGIYFPTYHRLKAELADDEGYNSPLTLMVAGCTASIPSTTMATPVDVIKTRLQVVAREGQTSYNGFFDCVVKLYKEEGARAFWKGTGARVLRSSPQYGVTLFTYELLQRMIAAPSERL